MDIERLKTLIKKGNQILTLRAPAEAISVAGGPIPLERQGASPNICAEFRRDAYEASPNARCSFLLLVHVVFYI